MNPERWATLFRELLQTPDHELGHYARRCGLLTDPQHEQLIKARELLMALGQALESAPGPNWHRVDSAWVGMRQQHGALVPTGGPPKPPGWVRENAPAKPGLGDPAPGTAGFEDQQRQRERFVPAAQPGYVAPPVVAAAQPIPPAAPAPPPPAAWNAPAAAPAGEAYAEPPPRRPPPPPRRSVPPATPSEESLEMSVARYASFCAVCAAYPNRVQNTQQQYGMADDAARRRLDDIWQDRFDADPALQEHWEQLFGQFRSRLR